MRKPPSPRGFALLLVGRGYFACSLNVAPWVEPSSAPHPQRPARRRRDRVGAVLWVNLSGVDATPFASVVALVVWVPTWNVTVRPASGVPPASFRTALRVTVLFGPPVSAPVYVTVVALRRR